MAPDSTTHHELLQRSGRMTVRTDTRVLDALAVQEIEAPPGPDWIIAAEDRVWVTGVADGLAVYEPVSGRRLGTIPIEGNLCGAPDAGFGSVWFPTCGPSAIHRVSAAGQEPIATIPIDLPAAGEFTIGAGEGGVWAMVEHPGEPSALARVSPQTHRVEAVFEVPDGGVSVRAGQGSVWIVYPSADRVLRIDPATGAVTSTFPTGPGPRFLVVGELGVWVLNQTAGSVTHIDPVTDRVVATVTVDDGPIRGGDIAMGDGSIWVRGGDELVAQIDPVRHTVVARFGAPSVGSASVAAVQGQLWISAGAEKMLYRIESGSLVPPSNGHDD
jgi:virginiamycin B lyase